MFIYLIYNLLTRLNILILIKLLRNQGLLYKFITIKKRT
jgi:hypothetical protein